MCSVTIIILKISCNFVVTNCIKKSFNSYQGTLVMCAAQSKQDPAKLGKLTLCSYLWPRAAIPLDPTMTMSFIVV